MGKASRAKKERRTAAAPVVGWHREGRCLRCGGDRAGNPMWCPACVTAHARPGPPRPRRILLVNLEHMAAELEDR